jgi:hypothetical protein
MQIKLFFLLFFALFSMQSCRILSSQPSPPLDTTPSRVIRDVPSVKLPFGTNIALISAQQPLIGDIKQGSRLAFQVVEPVQVGKQTVISAHAMGTVEVIKLQSNGSSRSDAVTLRAHSVALVGGRIVSLKSQDILLSVNLSDKRARLLPANFRLAAYIAEDVQVQ